MGTAYTPGLTVSEDTLIRKERRLPLKGQVLVRVGDEVQPETVVARTELPGPITLLRAAEKLGVEPKDVPSLLRKQVGETVREGELLAETKGLFGRFFKAQLVAPVEGTLERVNPRTGSIEIRHPPRPVEVKAYIRGRVVEVMEGEGAVIETRGAMIQGIFGVGGERRGILKVLTAAPGEEASPEALGEEHRGAILVTGGRISYEVIRQALEMGAVGIVGGCILDADLRQLLGYDLGVAITGQEAIGLTLVVTEGFGTLPMAQRTFALLRSLEGREASINGATQIRAGVIRPEVIVPRPELEGRPLAEARGFSQELNRGVLVRVIRDPYFGLLGRVVALPPELQRIPTGAQVRVLTVELEDGRQVTLPRANVEIVIE